MIEMRKGDTLRLDITLTNNGEPFIPVDEQIVFAVGNDFADVRIYILHEYFYKC